MVLPEWETSLIAAAKLRQIPAIDLEDVADTYEERVKYIKTLLARDYPTTLMIGTADLQQTDFPDFVETIFLLPDKNIYQERQTQRDREMPHKRGQKGEQVYDGFARGENNFKRVIKDTGTTEEILEIILCAGERT